VVEVTASGPSAADPEALGAAIKCDEQPVVLAAEHSAKTFATTASPSTDGTVSAGGSEPVLGAGSALETGAQPACEEPVAKVASVGPALAESAIATKATAVAASSEPKLAPTAGDTRMETPELIAASQAAQDESETVLSASTPALLDGRPVADTTNGAVDDQAKTADESASDSHGTATTSAISDATLGRDSQVDPSRVANALNSESIIDRAPDTAIDSAGVSSDTTKHATETAVTAKAGLAPVAAAS